MRVSCISTSGLYQVDIEYKYIQVAGEMRGWTSGDASSSCTQIRLAWGLGPHPRSLQTAASVATIMFAGTRHYLFFRLPFSEAYGMNCLTELKVDPSRAEFILSVKYKALSTPPHEIFAQKRLTRIEP